MVGQVVGSSNVGKEERFEFCFKSGIRRTSKGNRQGVKSVDQLLVEPVVVLRARDFVLVASRFTTRRCREAGSEIRRVLLILDVVSTDAGEVGGKRGE